MFWIIATILLGVIAVIAIIYNAVKDTKIDALEYEVAYLLDVIFNDHGDVVLRTDDINKIKDKWDKRIK
ncbi:DUF1514 family protein [Staphylococcus equorum]|uniref:DUF1514 family protein n=1 Tax=Staphylococcus equorum TaxID=246432 RepID=UPI00101C6FD9|nr:DUF1514 family protein [Staphylococcus equorum]RYD13644.1 hypothetical protein CGA19_01900 [Staphylococcus equorum]